jgi:insulysin
VEGSAFRKFGAGNKETLPRKNLRKSLVDFYNKFFSSNVMKLVVYGREDVGALELIIKRIFSSIPNKNLETPSYVSLSPFSPSHNTNLYFKMVPTLRQRELRLSWCFNQSSEIKPEDKRSVDFMIHLLSYRGTNSLYTTLKSTGLAADLNVNIQRHASSFMIFEIVITLKGKETSESGIERLLAVVGNYLNAIRCSKRNKQAYEECCKVSLFKFHYDRNIEINSETLLNYINTMRDPTVAEKNILVDDYVWGEFKEESLVNFINDLFNLKALNVLLLDKELKGKCPLQDKHFGTQYDKQEIPESWIKAFGENHEALELPSENPFLPQQTKVFLTESNTEDMPKLPQRIIPGKGNIVWFKQDNWFKLPRLYVNLRVYINR